MNYKVGAYGFTVSKKFKSNAEAVKHVQERYPHLTEDEIVNNLKPPLKDESDKSENVSEKNTESEKAGSEAGTKSTAGK